MKRLSCFLAFALALTAASLSAQSTAHRFQPQDFASDFQTVPVMGNVQGLNGANFQTYVAIYNPTDSDFDVNATLYDSTGTAHNATIALGSHELKAYQNFLDEVFDFSGAGAVTFSSAETAGGTHNNRFIVNTEVRTAGTEFGTSVPSLEFPGTGSPSFAAGVTIDTNHRANIGCFDQSGAPNLVKATLLNSTGQLEFGTVSLGLAANGWAQTPVDLIVVDGIIRFEPTDSAVCYAVVISNASGDGRFISATEFTP